MFNFSNVDRRIWALLMIAAMVAFGATTLSADESNLSADSKPIDLGGKGFQDPDEDEPDPDPWNFQDPDEDEPDPDPLNFQDPDEDEPDPDPFQDPDEDEPDPDPLVVEVHSLMFKERTTMLFQMEGAALMTLHNTAGRRLFAVGDGVKVVMTLAPGRYLLRVEERRDTRGAVQLHVEPVSGP